MANKEWELIYIKFYDNEGNCVKYTEKEYKRDLKRYLDQAGWFGKDKQGYFCKILWRFRYRCYRI